MIIPPRGEAGAPNADWVHKEYRARAARRSPDRGPNLLRCEGEVSVGGAATVPIFTSLKRQRSSNFNGPSLALRLVKGGPLRCLRNRSGVGPRPSRVRNPASRLDKDIASSRAGPGQAAEESDCIMPKMFPSVSFAYASQPMPGTAIFGIAMVPPDDWALATEASTSVTPVVQT